MAEKATTPEKKAVATKAAAPAKSCSGDNLLRTGHEAQSQPGQVL
jgi:hypothetical protein